MTDCMVQARTIRSNLVRNTMRNLSVIRPGGDGGAGGMVKVTDKTDDFGWTGGDPV